MSSDTDQADDSPSRSPHDIATDALADAVARFEDAQTYESIPERASAENQAAHEFTSELATAVVKGLNASQARAFCGQVAEAAKMYNKTEMVSLLDDAIEEARADQDSRRPLDRLVDDDLEEVVVVKTTDARQSTLYRWHFEGGVMFETQSTKDGRTHFSWPEFRNEYFDAAGRDPAKPTQRRRGGDEWREFIVDVMRDRQREVETQGPRSTAITALKNFIRRATAYADIEDMIDFDGIYIDDDPDDDPAEIWIPNHDIKRICDNNELESMRSLQVELDARGLTVERVNGVSERTFVNNNAVTYWVVSADIATPGGYEPDPQDPADQIRAEARDEADDNAPTTGAIGSVGVDPDDDEDGSEVNDRG